MGVWIRVKFHFKVPIVTPIYRCDLSRSNELHSSASVLAVSLNSNSNVPIVKVFHNFKQFRFNIRGLISTNIESDRRLFYWEGGDVNTIYPPSPDFISKDHPGMSLFLNYYCILYSVRVLITVSFSD